MHIKELIEKLEKNEIRILFFNHHTDIDRMIKKLQVELNFNLEQIEKYKHKNNSSFISEKEKEKNINMISFYEEWSDIKIGKWNSFEIDFGCSKCGDNIKLFLLDENTIAFISYAKFRDLKNEDKEFTLTESNLDESCNCKATQLYIDKKLCSTINVEKGKLIFQNFFRTDELREKLKVDHKTSSSICDVYGRWELMQDLATRDVGYGQMGNMCISVYQNDKNEIIIGANEEYVNDEDYSDEAIEKYKEKNSEWYTEERIIEIKNNVIQGEKYLKFLQDNNYKKIGDICLDMWRWMCADISVLEKYNEPEIDEYKDRVICDVTPGKYNIEHYYDFNEDENIFVYSKIQLIK